MKTITTTAELEAIYGEKRPASMIKEVPVLTQAYRAFVEAAPFVVMATSGSGGLDCSPKGDPAGFVKVLNERTLALPDRPGNNRIDSFRNIVEGSGFVQLIFFVPGIDETLRDEIDLAAEIAGENADRDGDDRCQRCGGERDDDRDLGAVQAAREHVAAEVVGSERIGP